MSNKLDFTFTLPSYHAHLERNSSQGLAPSHSTAKLDYTIHTTSTFVSLLRTAQDSIFQAEARPTPPMTVVDCLLTASKIIFFPITLLYCLAHYLCSQIAFNFGVGAPKIIDEDKRNELKALGGKEVEFKTEDQIKLEGMHFDNPRAIPNAKTVIICSGSHASYEAYTVPMVDALLRMGHHVMLFNYRGFGKSEGKASETGFNLDAEAAYQYVNKVQKKTDDQIAVLGYSLGSAPATDLAAHHKIKLVLDRYFSSMKDVAYDQGGFIAKAIFYLGGADFDIKNQIKAVEGGIFLARGNSDTTMKPYHQEYLKAALSANPKASFVEVYSSHIHYSKQGLWFHPENSANTQSQQALQNFLVNP